MSELTFPYGYDNKYIALNLPVPKGMPKTISVGEYTLLLKSEFHISLINVSYAEELINRATPKVFEADIVEMFGYFIENQPLDTYKPLKQFGFVQLDARKTIIGLVEVPRIDGFFEALRIKYQVDIPTQPTHITMYTLQPEAGIGISSQEQMERDSVPIELPEFDNLCFVTVSK